MNGKKYRLVNVDLSDRESFTLPYDWTVVSVVDKLHNPRTDDISLTLLITEDGPCE